MATIFEDYRLYYEARMKAKQGNPLYPNAYAAEKAIYDLVASCSSLEDLQTKATEFKALTVKNAIALVKDQETLRKAVYEDCKEFIRAEGSAAILDKAGTATSDMELVEFINRIMNENSIDITVDQLMSMFYNDFVAMENIEVYQQARIPDEWKSRCMQYARDTMDSGKKLWLDVQLPEARNWKAGWTLNYALLKEDRHRKLIPINDEELDKKIALHKTYKPA